MGWPEVPRHESERCEKPAHHATGSANGRAVLTEAQVMDIFNDKRSNMQLARHYGVGKSTVQAIKNGRSWGWLTKHQIVAGIGYE